MNTMLYNLGLAEYKRQDKPASKIKHQPIGGMDDEIEVIRESVKRINNSANQSRRDESIDNYRKVMKHYVMSSNDIAKFLGVRKTSVCTYMVKLEKMGHVEKVGEMLVYGSTHPTNLWKWKGK